MEKLEWGLKLLQSTSQEYYVLLITVKYSYRAATDFKF